jgi:hypothetical protein
MYRQALSKAVQPVLRSTTLKSRAAFSTTARVMAGGDTGAPRPTGVAGGYVSILPLQLADHQYTS